MDSQLERIQAALPQRYTLLTELDRLGTSYVYRAREELPDRDVVIKVLREDVSRSVGPAGFARIVELSSRLVHPHIVPIHSAGEAGDSLYYVLPYIEGESLRDRLDRTGPVPLEEAVRLTRQLAGALQHAHDRGIVHRDVKPTNVLLQGGHAFLADFGVAHALRRGAARPSPGGPEEGAGAASAYTSPEQREGDEPIDGRADTYALACIVAEMLTGRAPPARDAESGKGDPGGDAGSWDDGSIPRAVHQVLAQALSPDPRERHDRVAHFADALAVASTPRVKTWSDLDPERTTSRRRLRPGRIAGVAAVLVAVVAGARLWRAGEVQSLFADDPWRVSLAVMPFDNRTGDPAFDNLGQSLADEIINQLTTVPEVRVIDTYTAASLLKDSLGTPRLLDTLNVQHVIHGYVERTGDGLVVNVSASDRGGFLSRRGRHALDPGDLNTDQVELARSVALSFLERVGATPSSPPTVTEVGPGRDAYLVGNTLLGQRTPEAMREAIGHFRESIELEPGYAPAQAALSSAYALSVYYRYDVGLPAYQLAARSLAAADSAIALDPELANGYSARGYVRALLGIDIDGAEADFARAEQLAPNAPNGPSWSARILAERGQIDDAYREARRARDLDPLQAGRRTALASLAFQLGDYEVVIEEARQAYGLENELLLAKAFEGRALALTGRGVECLRIDFGVYDMVRALCLHSLGRTEEAAVEARETGDALASRGIEDERYLGELVAQDLAAYYGFVGDAERATRWLRHAFELSPAGVDVRLLDSALFDPVRDAPDFAVAVVEARRDAIDRVLRTRERLAERARRRIGP